MNIFPDFHQRFLFELLNKKVDFIVVGGLCVVFHGYIRTTGAMDLWIRPENNQKNRLIQVLSQFGISGDSINLLNNKYFTKMLAFHINSPPDKIEFLTSISGLHFNDAFSECDFLAIEGVQPHFYV